MREEARVGFLQSGAQRALWGRQRFPGLHIRIGRGQRGIGGHQAHFFLARQSLLAHRIPSGVVAAPVFFDPILRHVQRPMTCAQGQVGEPGLARDGCDMVAHVADSVVYEVLGQVVALSRFKLHRMVVLVQIGVPVINETAQETIPAVKSLAQRPEVA